MIEEEQAEVVHSSENLAFIVRAVRYQPCYQTITHVKMSGPVREIGHDITFLYQSVYHLSIYLCIYVSIIFVNC